MREVPLSEGISRTFNSAHDEVFKAAKESIVEAGLIVEQAYKANDKTWVIIGRKDASGMSWGELVRVVIEKTSDTETSVLVCTKRKFALNITAKGDYSQSILSNIDLKLH